MPPSALSIKLGSFCNTRRGGHLLLAAVTLPFRFGVQSNLDQTADYLRAAGLIGPGRSLLINSSFQLKIRS